MAEPTPREKLEKLYLDTTGMPGRDHHQGHEALSKFSLEELKQKLLANASRFERLGASNLPSTRGGNHAEVAQQIREAVAAA